MNDGVVASGAWNRCSVPSGMVKISNVPNFERQFGAFCEGNSVLGNGLNIIPTFQVPETNVPVELVNGKTTMCRGATRWFVTRESVWVVVRCSSSRLRGRRRRGRWGRNRRRWNR